MSSSKAKKLDFVPTGFNLLALLLCIVLVWAVLDLPTLAPGLSSKVQAQMELAGVTSSLTAVLLNFRGYDTLLEVAVLLLASIGCLTLREAHQPGSTLPTTEPEGPVLDGLIHLLIPVMLMAAGYLLWAGEHAPGGAFQAGAVLAAAGFLLVLGDKVQFWRTPEWLLRFALSLGLAVFLAVADGVSVSGRNLLEYPVSYAGKLILLVEAAVTLSIGSIFITLFAVNPPVTYSLSVDQAARSKAEVEAQQK